MKSLLVTRSPQDSLVLFRYAQYMCSIMAVDTPKHKNSMKLYRILKHWVRYEATSARAFHTAVILFRLGAMSINRLITIVCGVIESTLVDDAHSQALWWTPSVGALGSIYIEHLSRTQYKC